MEASQTSSFNPPTFSSSSSSRSHSSGKLGDDVTILTTFNPFSEEDENDQSSYALVASIFSRVKNSLSSATTSTTQAAPSATQAPVPTYEGQARRPSLQASTSGTSSKSGNDRPTPLRVVSANPAPPHLSLTPVSGKELTYTDNTAQNGFSYSPENLDGSYGIAIPGFPMDDSDARSIRTTASTSLQRSASAKVIRRLRGEGLSKEYWMDDSLCKECYLCKSVFTTWRRKHHCRICGQVFCAGCASVVIQGSRYGQEGRIRVCSLCQEKIMNSDDEDGDDDRRSVVSSINSPFAAHQLGVGESRSLNRGNLPQSPFAASQLFGRSDSFSLFSIAEMKRPYSGSDESGLGSRPVTPAEDLHDLRSDLPVPFRRALSDEDPVSLSDKFKHDYSPGNGCKTPVDFPLTVPIQTEGTSTVAFPISSPDQPFGPETPGMPRSRYNSYADFEGPIPMRSRVQSRLGGEHFGEAGWRMRRESTAYAQELNTISMFHLRIMLRQLLTSQNIPNVKEWEETLLKLALRIAREMTFTAHPHRQGADMDVRRYVKIKKIPGGSPSDSEYVDGAVITKNVAHKHMSRTINNPRVMLVTFPLEYHRIEGQYMHFQQLLLQEKEYLGNLANRIAALRPHIVLAEKSVSRLALEALTTRKIAVARSVKRPAIQVVARMTQGDVLTSIDKLMMEPHLGHCARVRVQTFDHALIPGRRKTYMRFEGCNREMGCTIMLRGGDLDVLKRIKKVTRFLAFTVRNLRLETHLWKDLVISLPMLSKHATPAPIPTSEETRERARIQDILPSPAASATQLDGSPDIHIHGASSLTQSETETAIDDLPNEDAERLRLSRRIQNSIEPYEKTFISVSATLRFPPPYPIRRMKELDDELQKAQQEYDDDVVRRDELAKSKSQEEVPTPVPALQIETNEDIAAQIENLPVPEPPATPTPSGSSVTLDQPGYFDIPRTPSLQGSDGQLVTSPYPLHPQPRPEVPIEVLTSLDIRLQSRLDYIRWLHTEQRRIWEWYLRKNKDDFDVEKYQRISLWQFQIPMDDPGLHRPCAPPELQYITFYGENDCTLGQFIETSVMETLQHFLNPNAKCDGKECQQPRARHCKMFVHNESRLSVTVEQWDGQITDNTHLTPNLIVTWSACRICGNATPFIPISEEMQRYSFAKFLELHFYPADVQLVPGAGCEHNIYKHHIRFFAVKGMTVRFQADPIVLHEVVYPPMRIRVNPESQLHIRNDDFWQLHKRNESWYLALIDDLKLISIDAATGDEESDKRLTQSINSLIQKAQREMEELAISINRIYRETAHTNTLGLNQVRAQRQDMIVAWQQDFDKLPKPKQIDKSSRKPSAFGSVRAMWPRKSDLLFYDQHAPSSSMSEAEDHGIVMRRSTGDSFNSTSSTSEAEVSESEQQQQQQQYLRELIDRAIKVETGQLIPSPPSPRKRHKKLEGSTKSDGDSDSTIGASRGKAVLDITKDDPDAELDAATTQPTPVPISEGTIPEGQEAENTVRAASRLPRRPGHQPNVVAELVKKYQGFIPPRGIEELTKTALAPSMPMSESEQEGSQQTVDRPRTRRKAPPSTLSKKSSISDFEHGYAANIAPRYIVHPRRVSGQGGSRIPAPVGTTVLDSHPPSRRSSPDKRPSYNRSQTEWALRNGRGSPPNGKAQPTGPFVPRAHRSRQPQRPAGGERSKSIRPSYTRDTGSSTARNNVKRSSAGSAGGKVSNITKHFERINRDSERAQRRYSVIRGRRARPVATARAKLEILPSIKDAIRDEEESDGSSSSEADDEGGDEEEPPPQHPKRTTPKTPVAPSETTGDDVRVKVDIASPRPAEHELPPETSDEALLKPSTPVEPPKPESAPVSAPSSAPPSVPTSPAFPPIDATPSSVSPPEVDIGQYGNGSSLLKALSGFWPNQPTRHEQDDIMEDPEHIFRDASMVVRTDEPTSIIALALNSPAYREQLTKSRLEQRAIARDIKVAEGVEAFMPDDNSMAETGSTWGVVNVGSSEGGDLTQELRVSSSKKPLVISFESSGITISCTILYPEQFDALRRTYECDRSMIESLSRCVKWDASGGKSGSAFLKTLDDRFIAKELSRAELQAMETFAPAYFDYMSSAVSANRPTLLAKIFGCFKISFKKTHKEKSSRTKMTQMNLLVMENLFYDRQFSKIYDLKGSTRNRHVHATGRINEVLLDENLIQTAHLAPFYLREHSKRIMRGALYNDSGFLSDLNVMDYSLVVGVDSEKNELVVGIVDYIRTYTWDKKLESWVKDSAFLANRGEPTIVSPKQYRQRFLAAMERYFPIVPDRWMKHHDAPEEEDNGLSDRV